MSEKPKGYWTELAPNGEWLYCHKIKRNGKTVTIKKSLRELEQILKPDAKAARV